MLVSTCARALMMAAALACLLGAGPAASACDLTVSDVASTTWTGARGLGYDVYDPQRRSQVIGFRVRSHDGGCPFYVTVSAAAAQGDGAGSLTGPGGTLRFVLSKDAGGNETLKPAGLATETDVFRGMVPAGGTTMSFQLILIVPPEQAVPPGLYSGEIEFATYEGSFGTGVLRDRRRVVVSAPVPSVAEISFSEGTGFDPNHNTYSANFGSMRAGDRRAVRIKARSNGGYRLLLQSVNGGSLRHVDQGDDSRVPYVLTVDGAVVGLMQGADTEAVVNGELTPAIGRQHNLEFSVLDVSDATAGDYRDVINVTVLSLR